MFRLRKTHLAVEAIHHEGGPSVPAPLHVGVIAMVVANPFAGRFAGADELQQAMGELKPLGLDGAGKLIAALGGAGRIEAYGKGALVGTAGELEHGALWHVPGGYAMRELLGEAKAIVPSTVKVVATGGNLDVPLHHVNAAYVRSHFSAIETRIADAPRPDEIAFCLAMATGGRIHARMGGLAVADIEGKDGLR